MTAQKGSLVLIKIGNGSAPETYATIGGLRISVLTVDNDTLHSTNVESGMWQQLSSGTGIRSMRISGGGMFTDSASEELLRSKAFSGVSSNYRFVFANGDYITGAFIVTNYERSGSITEEEIYTVTLESAGTISFTAV